MTRTSISIVGGTKRERELAEKLVWQAFMLRSPLRDKVQVAEGVRAEGDKRGEPMVQMNFEVRT